MTPICSKCGFVNVTGARFCSSCGSPLREPCPSCSAPVAPDDVACPHCSVRLVSGLELHERKTVTVLYADLVGSTSVGERFDIESHQTLMSAYHNSMREEAEAAGGTVEQFVGDAVLAVFGLHFAHEDDADRALDAGRRMLKRLGDLNEGVFVRHGLRLQIRIGINTGQVVVPSSGTVRLGSLAGDALNVAARLADHADPGSVLVSAVTARLSHLWRFLPVGSVDLRGRDAPVAAFEVVGPVDRSVRAGLQAPLTGRDHELAVLSAAQARVESEARPHVVTIFGDAGIGKSRLAAEFSADAGRRGSRVRALFGRCRPYGEAVAFGALAQILASVAEFEEAETKAEAAAKVDALIESLADESHPVPESAAAALGYSSGIGDISAMADLTATQVQAALRRAWQWLFERLSDGTTLIVTIEDLHWADPALLETIGVLAEQVSGPVLFLCPARPGLFDERATWGRGRPNFSTIDLEPLAPAHGAGMVEWFLGESGAASAGARIVDSADGNPYFIEEIIRGLVDEGAIVKHGSEWVTTDLIDRVHIPGTVQAVIAARIDRLAVDEKRVAQCAAVIGRTFWSGAVAHLLGAPVADVDTVLESLEEREMVTPGSESALTDERAYRFKHALVRDVAYGTLTRADRSSLHQKVGEWVRLDQDRSVREVIALEAHHLAMAYDGLRGSVADDGNLEELRLKAFESLLTASASAREIAALGQAAYFARQARRLAATPVEASQAAEALGEAYFFGYQGDPAWRAFREAIDLRMGESGECDPEIARLCARALMLAVRWHGAMQTSPDEVTVLRYLMDGMEHAAPDSEDAVRLLTLRGFWQHAFPRPAEGPASFLVTPEDSLRSSEQAVASARRMGRPDLESAALDAVTGYYIPRGYYSVARQHADARLAIVDQIDDLWEIGDTYAMEGWVCYHLGRYVDAESLSDAGYLRTIDEAQSLALQCLRWRAVARFRLGDWGGVRRDLAIARDLLGDDRDDPPDYVSPTFAVAALVHEYRGEHTAADAVLDLLEAYYDRRASDVRDASPLSQWAEFVAPIIARRGRAAEAWRLLRISRWRRGSRLGLLAEASLEVAAEVGDWENAGIHLERARSIAAEGGLEALPYAADHFEGLALAETGDLEGSLAILGRAAAGFDGLQAVWDAARTRLALADVLIEANRRDEARRELADCATVFEQLGARREIDTARELADGLA